MQSLISRKLFRMKISLLLFFIQFFINLPLQSKDFNILFVNSGFENNEEKKQACYKFSEELLNFYPLSEYFNCITIFKTDDRDFSDLIKFSIYRTFEFKTSEFINLIKNHDNINLTIFIIKNNDSKGQGGTVGKKNIPVIFICSGSKTGIISHEFCHSVLELGDEYAGSIPFPPSIKESEKFKNLTLNPINKEWEIIKQITGDQRISFYEGGMGRNKGIFHSYPVCLMNNSNAQLCPVCLYYSILKLNYITGQNIIFSQFTHQDLNKKKSPVPIKDLQ
jgi:hypothetical protein